MTTLGLTGDGDNILKSVCVACRTTAIKTETIILAIVTLKYLNIHYLRDEHTQ